MGPCLQQVASAAAGTARIVAVAAVEVGIAAAAEADIAAAAVVAHTETAGAAAAVVEVGSLLLLGFHTPEAAAHTAVGADHKLEHVVAAAAGSVVRTAAHTHPAAAHHRIRHRFLCYLHHCIDGKLPSE